MSPHLLLPEHLLMPALSLPVVAIHSLHGSELQHIGVGDLIELWDAVTWQERHDRIATNASNIMRRARGGVPHAP